MEFVLERDRGGDPVAAFRPDFYLPANDLFLEVTTLNQKLVTKKNRKVRRLLELYPEVRIKVLYQRDYLNLLIRFGLESPSQLGDVALDAGDTSLPFDMELPTPVAAGATRDASAASEAQPSRPEVRWPSAWRVGAQPARAQPS
ncbi:MAG: hypothetical protein J2O39_09000 [Acidimicrobiales bacterium]|nr:hypothetical protein [Acidimicrobiales bacterium]MBO0894502.1 hypothetical protein [Acidimicrobiales bacterium]